MNRGQLLAKAVGYVSVPIHAPVSGTIRKIANVPTISGKMVPGIYLEAFPSSSQEVMEGTPIDFETATPEEILQGIQDAGIVGLGGAAFPTHVKLKIPEGKHCEILMINGIECEPYLTTDHRVMLEQADDIFMGIKYLLKATGAKRAIIGIEANKQDAADHLERMIPEGEPVSVKVVPVKYPQGSEKMLITSILGREVPSGGLPIDVNVVVSKCGHHSRNWTPFTTWTGYSGTGHHHYRTRSEKERKLFNSYWNSTSLCFGTSGC